MKWFRLICLAALASQLVGSGVAADRGAASPDTNSGGVPKLPPVLRPSEPADSGQITLPGPPPVTPAVKETHPRGAGRQSGSRTPEAG